MAHKLGESVSTVDGIGETYATRLAEGGIETLGVLLRKAPEEIVAVSQCSSIAIAERWLATAYLLQVDGVDKDLAEAFVDAEIESITELADAGLSTLERAVEDAFVAGRLSEKPSSYALSEVQRTAGRLRGGGMVWVQVVDSETAEPVEDVLVSTGEEWARSDAEGWVGLLGIHPGRVTLAVTPRNGISLSVGVTVESERVRPMVKLHVATLPPGSSLVCSERNGQFVYPTPNTKNRLTVVDLAEVPADTHFKVRDFNSLDEARLLNLASTQVGNEIRIERVYVARQLLPEGAEIGTVLRYDGSEFSLSSETRDTLTKARVEGLVGEHSFAVVARTNTYRI